MNTARSTLLIKTEPAEVKPGDATTLRLMIHDVRGSMVKDFETLHEKKVHLIIVRDGLDHFAHIHPEIDPAGNLTITYAFPTGGTYRLYADYKPVGKDQTVATAEVKVSGNPPPAPDLIPNAPGKVSGSGLNAKVEIPKAKAFCLLPVPQRIR